MTRAIEFAVQAGTVVWHWIAGDGLLLLVAIYFATIACTILLAFHARYLARMVNRGARETERHALLLANLTSTIENYLQLLEAGWANPQSAERESVADERMTALPRIREEIVILQRELASNAAGGGDSPISPPRAHAVTLVDPDPSVETGPRKPKTLGI